MDAGAPVASPTPVSSLAGRLFAKKGKALRWVDGSPRFGAPGMRSGVFFLRKANCVSSQAHVGEGKAKRGNFKTLFRVVHVVHGLNWGLKNNGGGKGSGELFWDKTTPLHRLL